MSRRPFVLVVCAVAAAALALPAFGAAPSRSSISLVTLPAGSASVQSPSFGSQVTYTVLTSSTSQPWVETDCYNQNGSLVYVETLGFFASAYKAPIFTLGPTPSWSAGPASCVATLFSTDGNGKRRNLATTSFAVVS